MSSVTQLTNIDPSPVSHKRVKDQLLPRRSHRTLRSPEPNATLDTHVGPRMMHATTDCGRRHGRCGLAAEPWPREYEAIFRDNKIDETVLPSRRKSI